MTVLQRRVEMFVLMYAPQPVRLHNRFVEQFGELMNDYARLAIECGKVPDAVLNVCRPRSDDATGSHEH